METINKLSGTKRKTLNFLEALFGCIKKIKFTRTNPMNEDQTQLYTFLELAFIYAGENADKTFLFRDAISVCAPIICDLTSESGLEEFLPGLDIVKCAVEDDPRLPTMLHVIEEVEDLIQLPCFAPIVQCIKEDKLSPKNTVDPHMLEVLIHAVFVFTCSKNPILKVFKSICTKARTAEVRILL
ncbi:uncharacterized protein LOC144771452 [Lissotriton helveticus]